MSREEAHGKNPYMETWNHGELESFYYSCSALSPDGKCRLHNSNKKPSMCRDYPWYGRKPYPKEL